MKYRKLTIHKNGNLDVCCPFSWGIEREGYKCAESCNTDCAAYYEIEGFAYCQMMTTGKPIGEIKTEGNRIMKYELIVPKSLIKAAENMRNNRVPLAELGQYEKDVVVIAAKQNVLTSWLESEGTLKADVGGYAGDSPVMAYCLPDDIKIVGC